MLSLTNEAKFGDLHDILINDQTTREFVPGNYKLHIMNPDAIIICEEKIDPQILHEFLEASNTGEDIKCKNYIDRYDWMEYRNWSPASLNEGKENDTDSGDSDWNPSSDEEDNKSVEEENVKKQEEFPSLNVKFKSGCQIDAETADEILIKCESILEKCESEEDSEEDDDQEDETEEGEVIEEENTKELEKVNDKKHKDGDSDSESDSDWSPSSDESDNNSVDEENVKKQEEFPGLNVKFKSGCQIDADTADEILIKCESILEKCESEEESEEDSDEDDDQEDETDEGEVIEEENTKELEKANDKKLQDFKDFKQFIKKFFNTGYSSLIFFINSDKLSLIKSVNVELIPDNNGLIYTLVNIEEKSDIIGFILDARKQKGKLMRGRDWNYGCLMVDKKTKKCFAMVIESHYTNNTQCGWGRKKIEHDVAKSKYTYDMDYFYLKK